MQVFFKAQQELTLRSNSYEAPARQEVKKGLRKG